MSISLVRNATLLETLYHRVCLRGQIDLLRELKKVYFSCIPFSYHAGAYSVPIQDKDMQYQLFEMLVSQGRGDDVKFWTTLLQHHYTKQPEEMKGYYMDLVSLDIKNLIVDFVNSPPWSSNPGLLLDGKTFFSKKQYTLILSLMGLFPAKAPLLVLDDLYWRVVAKPKRRCFHFHCIVNQENEVKDLLSRYINKEKLCYFIVTPYGDYKCKITWGLHFPETVKLLSNFEIYSSHQKFDYNLAYWLNMTQHFTTGLSKDFTFTSMGLKVYLDILKLGRVELSNYMPIVGQVPF